MIKITVDCERNTDKHDLSCGGATVLGYDFYIPDDKEVEGYIELIKTELKKNHQPLISISHTKVDLNTKPWTEDMIIQCIKNGYE